MLAKSLSVKKECSLAGNLAFWKVNGKSISFWTVVLNVFLILRLFKKNGAKSTSQLLRVCFRCNHPARLARELLAKAKREKNARGPVQRGAGFRMERAIGEFPAKEPSSLSRKNRGQLWPGECSHMR